VPRLYRLEVTVAAQRDLTALARRPPDREILTRIDQAILGLATEPRPPGSVKLQGGRELWRVVVSDYRVLYAVSDDLALITIARVQHSTRGLQELVTVARARGSSARGV
jgi:mRNA interferase RelE/StbE